MAIDVNHQLRINYLLRNGACAIRVSICENLRNKGKMYEKQAIHDIYNAHSFYLKPKNINFHSNLAITTCKIKFTISNDNFIHIFPAKQPG
jgi:hypothetical protein